MTANHRIRLEITCPACGASGVIRVVEDAGPPFDEAPRRAYESDPDKFQVTPGSPPTVKCGACGAKVPTQL